MNPGNSPGILTAPSLDPTLGLALNFEFSSLNPVYSSASGSPNDVLRLTGGTPFLASLTASNAVNIHFNMDAVGAGGLYEGGVFTDRPADFLASIAQAEFNYYVKDAAGPVSYNGQSYSLMSGSLSVDLATIPRTADFADGTQSGRVMSLSVVPEPSTIAMLAMAFGALAIVRRIRG